MNNFLPLTYGDIFCVKKQRILVYLGTRLSTYILRIVQIIVLLLQTENAKKYQLFVECALLFLLDKVDEYKTQYLQMNYYA